MPPVIQVKNISKKYLLAHQRGGYIALRDVLANIARHPFHFFKDKTKQLLGKKEKEEFWALNDISFEINKGDVVGIIGHNGAGKSTLLKILSQITPPTGGEIRINGRVGSLLEVGTGFHPELTGRENIYLNGAILGMARREITKKFNDIVEFAGIKQFLDTPVKYYSSGMYVRLAFSVAAHVEPDILIVDEVLAVGDADFQKKCLGKMEEVTQEQGRTILLVSHNMNAIQSICNRCILLSNGEIEYDGTPEEAIELYLRKNTQTEASITFDTDDLHHSAHLTEVNILNAGRIPSINLYLEETFSIEATYEINARDGGVYCAIGCALYDGATDQLLLNVFDTDTPDVDSFHKNGRYSAIFHFPERIFNTTEIRVWIYLANPRFNKRQYHGSDKIRLKFSTNGESPSLTHRSRGGPLYIPIPCEVKSIDL